MLGTTTTPPPVVAIVGSFFVAMGLWLFGLSTYTPPHQFGWFALPFVLTLILDLMFFGLPHRALQ
jgi:hypothetical protein